MDDDQVGSHQRRLHAATLDEERKQVESHCNPPCASLTEAEEALENPLHRPSISEPRPRCWGRIHLEKKNTCVSKA